MSTDTATQSPRYELWKLEQPSENGADLEWMVWDFYRSKVAHFFATRNEAQDWVEGRGE